MSSYSHQLILSDSEVITLKRTLEMRIKQCEEALEKGEGAPFWADKQNAESILRKVHGNSTQMSGNNFWDANK